MKLFHWKKSKKEDETTKQPFGQQSPSENEPRKEASFNTAIDTTVPSKTPVKRLLSYQVANLQGIGTRKQQEDSFAFVNAIDVTEIKKSGLLAVAADGMGGMKGGKEASEMVIACLIEDFKKMDRSKNLGFQLRDSVLRAGDKVFELLSGEGGSTLVACILFQEQLYFASVGDSYLYLKRNHQLYRLNREHNVRNYLYLKNIRSGNMDPTSANQHREVAALTQFLGKELLDDIDFFRQPLPLQDGDTILLCSDGVGGVLTEQELLNCLTQGFPSDACCCMEQSIFQKREPYQDNYTALVINCKY